MGCWGGKMATEPAFPWGVGFQAQRGECIQFPRAAGQTGALFSAAHSVPLCNWLVAAGLLAMPERTGFVHV